MLTLKPKWTEYELVDSGGSQKLERFGDFTLVRPEPHASWTATLPAVRWEAAEGKFLKARGKKRGEWKFRKAIPPRWTMQRKNLKFWVQPSPSGHVGVFPDQACHWDWIDEVIRLIR